MSEQLDFLIELYTDFDASHCDCGGRMIPHIAHHVEDEIDWSRAVGLECENRCGHTIEIAELTTVIETLVGEVTRLRREREVLAATVQGYETARETLLGLFGDSFVRAGIETAFELVGRRREAARTLLNGNGSGNTRFVLADPDLNAWECQADDCQLLWEFEDGNPYDHDMRFCPRCGRRIEGGGADDQN